MSLCFEDCYEKELEVNIVALLVSFFGPATEKMDVVKSEREREFQAEGRGASSHQLKKKKKSDSF